MILAKAGCVRRKGSSLRSDERAEERAPLTAATSGQIIQLSGAKERKKNSARDNKNQEQRLHKIAHTTAVRHIVLCRIERRPPRLDLQNWPHLPLPRVRTTTAADYMTLLAGISTSPAPPDMEVA